MIAILITKETKYDCNDNEKGAIYDCNPFHKGPNMIAISKIVLESSIHDF